MNSFYTLVPLLVVLVIFSYGVARTILHLWLHHRLKLALLKKYERNPELLNGSEDPVELIRRQDSRIGLAFEQDYTITGIALAVLGCGCVVAGRIIGLGELAVGIYIGGMVCIALGILIALLGALIRSMTGGGLSGTQS